MVLEHNLPPWTIPIPLGRTAPRARNGPKSCQLQAGNEARRIYGRDTLTNGSKTLPDTDGRLRIARRFRGIANAVLADQGGASECSESRRQLIRRFSAACVLAEELEGRLARGEEIDVERHALLCSTLTRLAQRIGIDRRAKNITPSLGDYLRSPSAD